MKHQTRRKPDIDRVNLIARRLRLWVLEIIAWVAAIAGVKFRPDIAEEIYAAKLCVFLHAIHRCDDRGRVFMRRHWRGAAPGFRYRFQRAQLRAFTRVVKIKNLPELRDLLDDMEPAIARVLRQLRKSAIHTHLVPVAPRAEECIAVANAAVEAADTS
jgi:hypothetical protein